MKTESIVFAIAGSFFGLIVGWILGSQTPSGNGPRTVTTATTVSPNTAESSNQTAEVDLNYERTLLLEAEQDPNNAQVRTELGNMYFDAERFNEASQWYEASLSIDPANANVSTDLGVSYYYTNQSDLALRQFEHSLQVDPRHIKTLLNLGIVRAFGKKDLNGATESWEMVIEIAPDSPEALAAKQALESLVRAHPGLIKDQGADQERTE